MRPRNVLRWKLALGVGAASALLFPFVNRLSRHPGEAVIVLTPPALGALLWFGWPRDRWRPLWRYGVYALVMVAVLAGAEAFAAHMAAGRVLPREVFWAFYFLAACRCAWAVWARTLGRVGERWRRWGRAARRRWFRGAGNFTTKDTTAEGPAGSFQRSDGVDAPSATGARCGARDRKLRRVLALGSLLIRPARIALVLVVFAPLLAGALIHRIKIGNDVESEEVRSFGFEKVHFQTADGLTLAGWFMPERGADRTVLVCHGLGANRGNFVGYLNLFRGRGFNALIFDFRGHGDSDGHTATFGLYEPADVRAAVDWLKRQRPEAARRVFGLGSSMGAMALLRAAADDPRIEAVVLDSCFASAPMLLHQHLDRVPGVGWLAAELLLAAGSLHAGQALSTVDAAPALARYAPRPVLLIQGRDDRVIPPVNLELLAAAACGPMEQWLGPGPHSNVVLADFEGYQERALRFFGAARSGARLPGDGATLPKPPP